MPCTLGPTSLRFIQKAMKRLTVIFIPFLFSIKALTPNTDAQAESRLVIELDGVKASGRGVDVDIIRASVNGFVDALNRALLRKSYIISKENLRREGTV